MLFAKIGLIAAALVGLGAAATGVGVGVGVVGRAPQPAPQQPAPERRCSIQSPPRSPPPRQGKTEGRRRTRPRDGIDRPQRNEPATGSPRRFMRISLPTTQLPGRGDREPDGTPLLSWRVAILPYLGESEKALYGQFKLSEPWDSPHNKALLAKMPKVYAPAIAKDGEKDKNVTHYLGFVGKGALFERDQMVNLNSVERRNFQHADDRGSCDGRSLDQTRGPRIHRAQPAASAWRPIQGGVRGRHCRRLPAPVQEIPRSDLVGGNDHLSTAARSSTCPAPVREFTSLESQVKPPVVCGRQCPKREPSRQSSTLLPPEARPFHDARKSRCAPRLDLLEHNRRDPADPGGVGPPAAIRQRHQARRATCSRLAQPALNAEPDVPSVPQTVADRGTRRRSEGYSPSRAPRCICMSTLTSR